MGRRVILKIDADSLLYNLGFAVEKTIYTVSILDLGPISSFDGKTKLKDWMLSAGLEMEDVEISDRKEVQSFDTLLLWYKNTIGSIKANTEDEDYLLFLSPPTCFRNDIATILPYKGNRVDAPKPFHYQQFRDFLLEEERAIVEEPYEADDLVGIYEGDIIVGQDKDLKNIPHKHYNWKTGELFIVSEVEAKRNFYLQMLSGDYIDNIPGLYKLTGKKCTSKMKQGLSELEDEKDMFKYVYNMYLDCLRESKIEVDDKDQVVSDWLLEIGRLLDIRTKRISDEYPLWSPPA